MGLFNFFVQDIAIDLGTANTIIYYQDKVVVDQPSIVAKDIKTGKAVAIGRLAQQMQGKTHKNIETIRPLRRCYRRFRISGTDDQRHDSHDQ